MDDYWSMQNPFDFNQPKSTYFLGSTSVVMETWIATDSATFPGECNEGCAIYSPAGSSEPPMHTDSNTYHNYIYYKSI